MRCTASPFARPMAASTAWWWWAKAWPTAISACLAAMLPDDPANCCGSARWRGTMPVSRGPRRHLAVRADGADLARLLARSPERLAGGGPYLRSLAQIHRGGGTLSDLNSAEQAELWALADPHDRRCLRSRPAAARQRVAPDLNPKKTPRRGSAGSMPLPGRERAGSEKAEKGRCSFRGPVRPGRRYGCGSTPLLG